MNRILVTGALGQLGTELVPALAARYGAETVIASDIRYPADSRSVHTPTVRFGSTEVEFRVVDCTDTAQLGKVIGESGATVLYHLAALLSALAEERPQLAWQVNAMGTFSVLEAAREYGCQVFVPSSIAAFGPSTPRQDTPQETLQRPQTIYGVSKVTGELLCDYYWTRFSVDTRGVRYPGLISHGTEPGGGTTDYAVDIFRAALRYGSYTCFLQPDTQLDMMYMPDAIQAAIQLMEADAGLLRHRNAFNITSFSCTPELLAEAISAHIPGFTMRYEVDPLRQAIADSWPDRLDDSEARKQWGFSPSFGLQETVTDMLDNLERELQGLQER